MRITTVIPAYKPAWFLELLGALARQTVRPAQVLVSDDSPDDAFAALLATPAGEQAAGGLDVQVLRGPKRGAYANWRAALAAFGGRTELFHLCCDDDIVYPGFYERHLMAHRQGRFGVTVSRRWTADEHGRPLRDLPVPPAAAHGSQALWSLDAGAVFPLTVARGTNWLGEVSNAVYRAEHAPRIGEPQVGGVAYLGLEDIGSFVTSTLEQPLCWINDHLGFFRTSAHQASQQHYGRPLKLAHGAYIALSVIGRRAGHLSALQLREGVAIVGGSVLHHYAKEADVAPLRALLSQWLAVPVGSAADEAMAERFVSVWHDYALDGVHEGVGVTLRADTTAPA